MGTPKPHVVIFPSAGIGHLVPFAELAKRLSEQHGLSITFMTCQWMFSSHLIAAFSERMASASLDITFVQLPTEVEFERAEHMQIETQISMVMEKSKGSVEIALRSLLDSASPVSAFITDFFCTAMFDVTAKLCIPTYAFLTSTASLLSLMFSIPKVVSEMTISFKDADFPVDIPGLPPMSSRDMPSPLLDRSNEAFFWFVHHFSRLREIKGVLLNTFEELETEPIKALVEGKIFNLTDADRIPRVYPVGPVISLSPLESHEKLVQDGRADCLKWLDNQPPSSVLFVSFGSAGALPKAQVIELALGLEASQHRFLWVLRTASKGLQSIESETKLTGPLLPDGFESRTRDRGLVVTSWVPQILILSHPSTAGFLSHCGWNSTVESISHGVPMITWPLFAEQRMNKFLLVNVFKVAIEAKMESDGFVQKEEVESAVMELMEGEGGRRVRARARELKEKAMTALEEGGSSDKAMAAVVSEWSSTGAGDLAGIMPIT